MALGRLGAVSVLLGTAVHIVEFSSDGFGLPLLARVWVARRRRTACAWSWGAEVILAAIGGPAVLALTIAWGATLLLYGLAVTWEGYARGVGWAGVVVGAALFALGVSFYLAPNSYPGVLFFGLGTVAAHLWAIVLGVAMWRRAREGAGTPNAQRLPTARSGRGPAGSGPTSADIGPLPGA